jgi:4-amino-4-deoxy-L-arabinose transferase-like glycosyltransferase
LALSGGPNLRGFIERFYIPLAGIVVAAAVALRLYALGRAFGDYDEGVYLETLMAMARGNGLYRDIFYSQPPAFILAVFPFFRFCGENLWAARFGIVVLSLAALPAAALAGAAIGGRCAALAGLALIAFDPVFLGQSRALEAEAPQIAFSFLAVALALRWAGRPNHPAAPALAGLAGAAASFGTLCKLSGITAVVPLAFVIAAAAFERGQRRAAARALVWGTVGAAAVMAAFLLPFRGEFAQLWRQVVTFHIVARGVFGDGPVQHAAAIGGFLARSPAAYAALFGAGVGLLRRDRMILPALGWFLATVALLLGQTPLFEHHLVMLVAPLGALALFGFTRRRAAVTVPLSALGLGLAVLAADAIQGGMSYARGLDATRVGAARQRAIADAIAGRIDPDRRVITDCQFAAALAQRSTPAALADTSFVRIETGFLTAPDLVAAAARPDVGMVLFCGHQLDRPELAPFRLWVARHFRLALAEARPGLGFRQLWIRPPG